MVWGGHSWPEGKEPHERASHVPPALFLGSGMDTQRIGAKGFVFDVLVTHLLSNLGIFLI